MKDKISRRQTEGVHPSDENTKDEKSPSIKGIQIRKSVTIDRPREDLYEFWRHFQNLPQFMENVLEVSVRDEKFSHWKIAGPAGATLEWEAMIIADRQNEMVSWRSVDNPEVENAGSVHFRQAPNGRGTVVTATLTYNPPAGKIGGWIAMLFGKEPSQQLSQDLRRFKALMETGEVPTSGNLMVYRGQAAAEARS
jgi:uncharacterized membrane protein